MLTLAFKCQKLALIIWWNWKLLFGIKNPHFGIPNAKTLQLRLQPPGFLTLQYWSSLVIWTLSISIQNNCAKAPFTHSCTNLFVLYTAFNINFWCNMKWFNWNQYLINKIIFFYMRCRRCSVIQNGYFFTPPLPKHTPPVPHPPTHPLNFLLMAMHGFSTPITTSNIFWIKFWRLIFAKNFCCMFKAA